MYEALNLININNIVYADTTVTLAIARATIVSDIHSRLYYSTTSILPSSYSIMYIYSCLSLSISSPNSLVVFVT